MYHVFLVVLPLSTMDIPDCSDFHARLNEQRITGDMCDLKIISRRNSVDVDKTAPKEFMAHMAVLSAASPHFTRVLHSDFKEAVVGEVTLDMDAEIVEILLEYMYTYKIEIDESIAPRLLQEASYLQLDRLKERCSKFLLANITDSNCIEMWSYSRLYSCTEMKDLAWNMMCRNFDSLIDSPEFLGLEKDDICTLLSDKSLRCRESSVFTGVCNWVRADLGNRKQHMKELLALVRLSCLKKDFLFEKVGKEPLVTEDRKCFQILYEAVVAVAKTAPDSARNRRLDWKPSGGWTKGPKLTQAMERCSAVNFLGTIYCASKVMAVLEHGKWLPLATPPGDCFWKLCVVGDSMYAVGVVSGNRDVYKFTSSDGGSWTLQHRATGSCGEIICHTSLGGRICVADLGSNTVEAFTSGDAGSRWVRLGAFPNDVSDCSTLCDLKGQLMAIGGYNGNVSVNTVQTCNTNTGRWVTSTMPDKVRVQSVGAVSCDNRVLIAGGKCVTEDKYGYHRTENYVHDVKMLHKGSWTSLPSLKKARQDCAVVELNHELYVIGGFNNGPLLSVEILRFD